MMLALAPVFEGLPDAESWVLAGIVAAVWVIKSVAPLVLKGKDRETADRVVRTLETAADASGSYSPPATMRELAAERVMREQAHAEHERRINELEEEQARQRAEALTLERTIASSIGKIQTDVAVLAAAERRRSGQPPPPQG